MAVELSIDQDLKRFERFTNNTRKQLPFATKNAINDTAFKVRDNLRKGTKGAFNVPTNFTQNKGAFLVNKAKKTALISNIFANDKEGRNRARYLRYGAKGGVRPPKGFELYFGGLKDDGTIPSNSYFQPTSLVKKDRHGNVTRATLKRITKGISGNARGGFFIGTPAHNQGKPPGIYRRSRLQLFPYFIATTTQPNYNSIFDIQGIGDRTVKRNINEIFSSQMNRAIATAK